MGVLRLKRWQPYLSAAWDIISIGVIGLASFITLYNRQGANTSMAYVIVIAMIAYVLMLGAEILFLRVLKKDESWRIKLRTTRKVFRLIHTSIYLTIIAANLIGATKMAAMGNMDGVIIQNIIAFVGVAVVGTSCLWRNKALMRLVEYIMPEGEAREDTPLYLIHGHIRKLEESNRKNA